MRLVGALARRSLPPLDPLIGKFANDPSSMAVTSSGAHDG